MKRHFTLLEILIALGLTTILLTALMGLYFQMTRAEVSLAKLQEDNFRLLYTQYRLGQVLPTSLPPSADKGTFFYTLEGAEGVSLIFSYDNGTGKGPNFSNQVIGRLFIDQEKNLRLITWPLFSRESAPSEGRDEILLREVSALKFNFYIPQPSGGIETTSLGIDDERLPAIIKVYFTHKGKETHLAFVLPNGGHPTIGGEL